MSSSWHPGPGQFLIEEFRQFPLNSILAVIKIFILSRQQKLPEIIFPAGKTKYYMLNRPVIGINTLWKRAFTFRTNAFIADFQGIWIIFES